jgi:glycosyltransferase involved in cell wall biosynthesis
MKIIIIQDYLRSGGTERQSVLLANAFAAAGHATTLLTFRPGGALAGTVAPAVSRPVLQLFDTRMNWFAPGLNRAIDRADPDIVLCMGRMANCRAAAIELHHRVWQLPGGAPRNVVGTMRTGKSLPSAYIRGLQICAHIVANSHDAARVLTANYAVPSDKISVIHNSLVFPPDSAGGGPLLSRSEIIALRAHHGATPATTVLLCVAMFRPEKNHRFLVEMAARFPRNADWQLWLAGEGETHSACTALAARLGVTDRVRFLGFTPDPAPLYCATDLAVLASQSESLPNFLIEAQAHGLPVIACDIGGVRECFVPGQTGWTVPPDDPAAFLAALAPLLSDPARRAAIAPHARAFARESFSPARQTAAYLELFSRLRSPS